MRSPDQFDPHWSTFQDAMKVRGYSPTTISNYQSSLRVFGSYLDQTAIADIREVNSATMRDFQLWLQNRDHAGWTIMARLQAVRRFFDHLEKTEVVLLNPCRGLESPKVAYRLPKTVLTVQEAQRMLDLPNASTPIGLRDKAILEMFYSCGVRLAEMTHLKLADVDSRNGLLRVNQGKGARDRVVPLGQGAGDCVRRYVEQVRRCWCPPERDQQALWLSSCPAHQPLTSQTIAVMVRRYGKLAGIPRHVTPHLWRHTCAAHLVANGASIAYVQRILGHGSLRTTQIYVRTTITEIKATHALAHPRNQDIAP
jgi:integrase/recombinase XerD